MKKLSGHLSAVVLDWAGTTVDHGCLAPVAALRSVLVGHGLDASDSDLRMGMGLPKKDHLRALLAARDAEALTDELYPELENALLPQLEPHSTLIAGTLELCGFLKGEGVPMGTTTGYTRAMMRVVAAAAARQGYVPDAIVTPDDVPAGRPAPYMMYQNALLLRAVPLWTFVKVGDTPSDMLEGARAGAWTIGVALSGNALGLTPAQLEALPSFERLRRREIARTSLEAAGADVVVDSIADCPAALVQIAGRLAAGERPGVKG
jgi:phosphonoacetaldehyde hydrolase